MYGLQMSLTEDFNSIYLQQLNEEWRKGGELGKFFDGNNWIEKFFFADLCRERILL